MIWSLLIVSLDDQPEINEYLRYQRTIRDLKDENSHLRDELANLRKTFKAQQAERDQVRLVLFQKFNKNVLRIYQSRRDNEINQLEQVHAEQMSTCRRDYDEQIQKLQSRIAELEEWNKNHQGIVEISVSNNFFFSRRRITKINRSAKRRRMFLLNSTANKILHKFLFYLTE